MGLLRSLAKKALGAVVGTPTGPSASTPAPPPRAEPAAPAPKPVATPPAPAAPSPKPAPVAAKPVAAKPAAAKPPGAPTTHPPEGYQAGDLATIECGAQEVKERLDAGEPVLLLDVREPFETTAGILPNARLIPLGQLPDRWREISEANEVVCYCAAGIRSLQAAAFLREKGVFNATSMVGGIGEWMSIGGTVVRPA